MKLGEITVFYAVNGIDTSGFNLNTQCNSDRLYLENN